jgi:hypothetical protein
MTNQFLMMVMTTAAAFLVVVMTAATTFLVMMVVTAVASLFVVMVMTTAAAFLMVVMTAATALFLVMVMTTTASFLSGTDGQFPLHSPGNGLKFRNQRIRMLCLQPKGFGGKRDSGRGHKGMGIEFLFYFRCAIGTVQIFQNVAFRFHGISSRYVLSYERMFI